MLVRKMLRECKKNKIQFISIFIISFLGVFVFSGLSSIGMGMDSSVKKFYKETNLADASIHGDGLNKESLHNLKKSQYIQEATGRLTIDTTYEDKSNVTLQLNYISGDEISGFKVLEGDKFQNDSKGIWLDSQFASAHNIEVGDNIVCTYSNYKTTSTVKGLIMQPDYIYAIEDENQIIPNHSTFGYGFLSEAACPLTEIQYSELLLKTTSHDKSILEKEIKSLFLDSQIFFIMKSDFRRAGMFKSQIQQMKAVGSIFPIVFLMIAALTTLTTMTRITSTQRIQIGTLKALGFSNGKILAHYMSYGFFISLASGILGLATGPYLLPKLAFHFQKSMYTMPYWEGKTNDSIYLVVFLSIALCTVSSYFSCRSQLDKGVAQVLRPKPMKAGKHSVIEKSKVWKKTGFSLQWNVRDIRRNKVRSFVTVLGIVGCMMLILCAVGMKDTTQNLTEIMYEKLYTYNTKVTMGEDKVIEKTNKSDKSDDNQYIMETVIEYKGENENKMLSLTVAEEGDYLHLQKGSGELMEYPDFGVAISEKTAKELSLEKGDILTWKRYGTNTYRQNLIVEVVSTPMGQGIYMSQNGFEKTKSTFVPTGFLTSENSDSFQGMGYESIQSKNDLIEDINSMLEMLKAVIGVMIGAAVLLGVVVLYNLGAMSFYEKARELATLRVLGFQYKKLSKLLQQQNIWLTLIGIMMGIPCGYYLLANMMTYMGESMDMDPKITLSSYGLSCGGILLLSIIVNYLLSRKLKKIDMVSALKTVE